MSKWFYFWNVCQIHEFPSLQFHNYCLKFHQVWVNSLLIVFPAFLLSPFTSQSFTLPQSFLSKTQMISLLLLWLFIACIITKSSNYFTWLLPLLCRNPCFSSTRLRFVSQRRCGLLLCLFSCCSMLGIIFLPFLLPVGTLGKSYSFSNHS